ncbi:MAG: hypothetical protein ACRDJ4_02035, partial [Actinomycetota bacterium]
MVPSKRWTAPDMSSNAPFMMAVQSSGSTVSIREVESTTSAKMAVTVRRSPLTRVWRAAIVGGAE